MKVCPKGWHLPNWYEWEILTQLVGEEKEGGILLKATSGWEESYGDNKNGEDKYGFSALPGGQGNPNGGFSSDGYIGYWWTANSSEDSDDAYRRYIDVEGGPRCIAFCSEAKNTLYSVRCVKD